MTCGERMFAPRQHRHAAAAAAGLVGDMERESTSVADRMAALESDEKRNLRARLDAKQKEQADKLLSEINYNWSMMDRYRDRGQREFGTF